MEIPDPLNPLCACVWASRVVLATKNLPANAGDVRDAEKTVPSLEQGMATHCSVLAWKIPWTEEPGGLYSPWGHKESDTTEAT